MIDYGKEMRLRREFTRDRDNFGRKLKIAGTALGWGIGVLGTIIAALGICLVHKTGESVYLWLMSLVWAISIYVSFYGFGCLLEDSYISTCLAIRSEARETDNEDEEDDEDEV